MTKGQSGGAAQPMGGGGLCGVECFARRVPVLLQPRSSAPAFARLDACRSMVAGRSLCSAGQAGILVRGVGRSFAGLLLATMRRGVADDMEPADGQKKTVRGDAWPGGGRAVKTAWK